MIGPRTMLGRAPRLDQVAQSIAFLASDRAAGITGDDAQRDLRPRPRALTWRASDFETRAQRHRRELHVHCYRMLGSFDEAEDAVQETLLRAWRGRSQVDSDSGFRPWLYRIATNYCLDVLRRRKRRPQAAASFAEIPWLQPYPDRLLDEIPAAAGRRARRGGGGARDDRAGVHRGRPGAAAAPAGRGAALRRAGLVGAGDRRAARDEPGRDQQRAAAGAGDPR